ncbi:lysylphosphatidylglycerol synthase transmembrane domain-containing protein [Frankia sp. R82]|uniref:lysylphosphatidylglycerol synthase transmembrane domain-containing protein n=1 Tax=Frankia sp. R82 TaxID=2950553 RepID=UPI002042F8B2|nr:lysylphosphatidylglycerol synthase transmembrane domain-containing protein [Frankia sp. R82]MCM3882092.1 flippase-like domain-containing protein [Frankia sp. R82]
MTPAPARPTPDAVPTAIPDVTRDATPAATPTTTSDAGRDETPGVSPASAGEGVAPARGRWRAVRPALACVVPVVMVWWVVRSWSTVRGGMVALGGAHPGWLIGALVVAQLTWFAGAACQQGAVSRALPVRPLLAAQVAGSVANHVLPAGFGVGAVKLRFLHRHGFSLPESLTAVGLDATAGVTTHLAVLLALLGGGFLPVDTARLPDGGSVLSAVAVTAVVTVGVVTVLVAIVALLGRLVPAVRRGVAGVRVRVAAPLRGRLRTRLRAQLCGVGATLRSPGRAALLWGGSAAIPLVHALTLWAIVHALHLPLGIGAVLTLYYVASTASAMVPSPGGFGSLDAALAAALITAGQTPQVALGVVLGYRLVTVWLPMAPSACVLAVMVRRGQL